MNDYTLRVIMLLFSQDFRHEVNVLVKLRHPNIVQFLGAVTDKKPLMLVTEYLRGVQESYVFLFLKKEINLIMFTNIFYQGDLHQYLKEKGSLSPQVAVNFALDIARYL